MASHHLLYPVKSRSFLYWVTGNYPKSYASMDTVTYFNYCPDNLLPPPVLQTTLSLKWGEGLYSNLQLVLTILSPTNTWMW